MSNFQPAQLDRIIAETGVVPAVNHFDCTRTSPTDENLDLLDFELPPEELASIDALDKESADGPDPIPTTYDRI